MCALANCNYRNVLDGHHFFGGGYNANQVAHHIMSQAGDRLSAAQAPDG